MCASSATSPNTRSTRRSRTACRKHIGSVEKGKLADLVLWSPAFFGVKPEMVIKGGSIAAAPMGDPNASIPTPQPVHYRPMFGAFGKRAHGVLAWCSSRRRRSKAASRSKLGVEKQLVAVEEHARHLEEEHDPQRRDAGHQGRPGNLRGARRRRAADLRAGRGAADGAALFPVLGSTMKRVTDIKPAGAGIGRRRMRFRGARRAGPASPPRRLRR